jgi:hypothetical protein
MDVWVLIFTLVLAASTAALVALVSALKERP